MSTEELLIAFRAIHPDHRTLTQSTTGGKAAHWTKLMTVPKPGDLSQPLVHLELGHGSAHALARFFLAAMAFARELEEKPDAKAE